MARKKIEPITSLGSEDKLTVQKSLPLFALWRSELTLAEFKILDTYLSRIDSHKPDKRVVMFEKGELESILGVKKINNKELEERLKHLMENVVKIPDGDERKGFRLISLFEEAVAEQDEYGLWQVKLECTQKAMKYIFNVENLGYLRYKLRCITSITSRYTYIMFVYLEANRFRKSWEVPLNELKEILSCDKEELYKEFKFFNQKILKRVQTEMHEKTECKYSYEPIKKGRSVVAVRFTVETLPKANIEDIDENQMTLEQWQAETDRRKELWEEAVAEFSFTSEQITTLREVLVCIPEHKMPQSTACYDAPDLEEQMNEKYGSEKLAQLAEACNYEFGKAEMEEIFSILNRINIPPDKNTGDIHWGRVFYLREKYAALNVEDSRKKASGTFIKNRYAYFKKMLEKDTSTPAAYGTE